MTDGTKVGPSRQPPNEFCHDARILERSALNSLDSDDDDLEPLFSLQVPHRVHLSRSVGVTSNATVGARIVNSVRPYNYDFNATTSHHRQLSKGCFKPFLFTP